MQEGKLKFLGLNWSFPPNLNISNFEFTWNYNLNESFMEVYQFDTKHAMDI